jgi:hypothetical protein
MIGFEKKIWDFVIDTYTNLEKANDRVSNIEGFQSRYDTMIIV